MRCWLLLFAILTTLPSASRAAAAELSAARLELSQGRLWAEGAVRLRLGGCCLLADSVRWSGSLLRLARIRLEHARLGLQALEVRIQLPAPVSLEALLSLNPTSTPLAWSARRLAIRVCGGALRLGAAAAKLKEGVLWLDWPVLRAGALPIFTAPRWRLPLRRGVSGFLWPVLGYDRSQGFRFRQGIYWAHSHRTDATLRLGLLQRRGPTAGLTLRSYGDRFGGRVVADGLMEEQGEMRGTVRLLAAAVPHGPEVFLQLGVNARLVSDGKLLQELPGELEQRYAPLTRSRLWGLVGSGPLTLGMWVDLWQLLDGQQATPANIASSHARLNLARAQIWGPIWLDGIVDAALSIDAPFGGARRRERHTSAGLWLGSSNIWGPLRSEAVLGALWHASPFGQPPSDGAMGAATVSLELGLPLHRGLGDGATRRVHWVEPFVFQSLSWGRLPGDPEQSWRLLLMAGLRSALLGSGTGGPRGSLEVWGGREFGGRTMAMWRVDLAWSEATFAALGIHLVDPLSTARGDLELCVLGSTLCSGAIFWGARGWDLSAILGDGREAIYWRRSHDLWNDQISQIWHSARLSSGRLALHARVGWDPARRAFSYAEGTLSLARLCGRFRVKLLFRAGASDARTRMDGMLALSSEGGAFRGCGSEPGSRRGP